MENHWNTFSTESVTFKGITQASEVDLIKKVLLREKYFTVNNNSGLLTFKNGKY